MITIYVAGSIRGSGFEDQAGTYKFLIQFLKDSEDNVLTGLDKNEKMVDCDIYKRDVAWIKQSDMMIAEITAPSLGVGYEIAVAESLGLPVLCLYRSSTRPSAMLMGNTGLRCEPYRTREQMTEIIDDFISVWESEDVQNR